MFTSSRFLLRSFAIFIILGLSISTPQLSLVAVIHQGSRCGCPLFRQSKKYATLTEDRTGSKLPNYPTPSLLDTRGCGQDVGIVHGPFRHCLGIWDLYFRYPLWDPGRFAMVSGPEGACFCEELKSCNGFCAPITLRYLSPDTAPAIDRKQLGRTVWVDGISVPIYRCNSCSTRLATKLVATHWNPAIHRPKHKGSQP